MEQLPQSEHDNTEMQSVSTILARSDPADMPAMRTSLSFLTYAGAEMAGALLKRNQEYDELRAILAAFPPEWIEAAKGGGDLPDLGALRRELEVARDQRIDLQAQLAEREIELNGLQSQLAELRAELETQVVREDQADAAAELATRIGTLEADVEAAQLARAAAEDLLRERDAELDDLEVQFSSLNAELLSALPVQPAGDTGMSGGEDIPPSAGDVQAVESPPQPDGRERRAMKLGALAASIAAVVEQNRLASQALQDTLEQTDILKGQLFSVQADRMAMDADLQEKTQSLADTQAEIETLQTERESLTSQIDELTAKADAAQADLDAVNASLAETQEQLTARENELAEIQLQIDSLGKQLGLAPEVEADAAAGGEAAEGQPEDDTGAESGAAAKMLGVGALAAGINALSDKDKARDAEAAELSAQIDSLTAEKAALEEQAAQQQQAVTDLTAQVDSLTAEKAALEEQVAQQQQTIDDLNGQIETLNATVANLQGQLEASQAELNELNEQVDAVSAALKEVVPDQPAEDEEGRPVGRLAALTALAGGAAAAVHHGKGKEDELAGQVATYEEQVTSLTGEKADLEAKLQDQSAQIDALNGQLNDLQANLDATATAKADLEATLQEKEQALAEYNDGFLDLQGQVNSLASEKSGLEIAVQLKDEELAQLRDQLAVYEADAAQVQEAATRSMGERMAGVGVVTAGAAAAAALQDKDERLAALQEQLEAALAEKTAVEEQLAAQGSELEETRARLSTAAPFEEATQVSEKLASMPAAKRSAATAAILAGVQPYFVPGVQALNDVDGIGPVFQQRLYKAGIGTYWEVSCLSNEEMQESLQIPEMQLDRVDYSGMRASAYQLARESDSLGAMWEVEQIDDFEVLPGIGATFEKRLYMAGIFTYAQLVEAGKERVAEIIDAPEFRQPDYDQVIELARSRLQAGNEESAPEPEAEPTSPEGDAG